MARTRYRADFDRIKLSDLPAGAMRAVWREGYTRADLRADVLAGLVVGIVALPLAMALAIAVGVAPQYGLYTSIVAGAVVAALGGSRLQVTGPTAAFIVILAPIYSRFGMAGLLLSGLMGGLMLIAMGLGRLGQFIEFIPHPVTTGFTAGIATVIATLQVKDVLGLSLSRAPESFFDRVALMWRARGSASLAELAVAMATLALLLAVPRLTRRIPAPLVAIPLAGVLAAILNHVWPAHAVATIASRFHATVGGRVFSGVPPFPPLPMLPWAAPGPGGAALHLSLTTLRELLSGRLRRGDARRHRVAALRGDRRRDGRDQARSRRRAPGAGDRQRRDAVLRRNPGDRRHRPHRDELSLRRTLSRGVDRSRADRPRRGHRPGAAHRLPADGGPGGAAPAGRLEHVGGEALRPHPARRTSQRRLRAHHLLRPDRRVRHGRRRLGGRGAGGAAVHAADGGDHPHPSDG